VITFNRPPLFGNEMKYVSEAIHSNKISGDGDFTKRCQIWFEKFLGCKKALLVPSGTAALEMCAILIDIKPGDEVIMPSYTFVSTANAFVLRGAKIVFVDICPKTMNIDQAKIADAISPKTRAIVVVHYAGVSCEMNSIKKIADDNNVFLIEDAAQAIMSTYDGKPLGSIGHISAFSFHETKNLTSGGEGGLLAINDSRFCERAEIIREKGTNRSKFFRGHVDKYTWVDMGSSYLASELQAAYLWGQLAVSQKIINDRLHSWNKYFRAFESLEKRNLIKRPFIPKKCEHNAHMFYLMLGDCNQRDKLIDFLKAKGIMSVFHYIPLHSSPAGNAFGYFYGQDNHTTDCSERLLRLPLYFGLEDSDAEKIINSVKEFFS